MHKGKTLQELANELQRREEAKRDYVADTRLLLMEPDGDQLMVQRNSGYEQIATHTTSHAHGQLATWAGIPRKYYDKMMESDPALLSMNVNHWLKSPQKETRRMVRTLDGQFRAFLSDRYRIIDNYQVAQAALAPMLELSDRRELEILSCDVTDRRLYIQARFPRLEREVKVNDPVQAGVIITNSEIGAGSLVVKPLLYRLVCLNGMVVGDEITDTRMRRNHVGRRVQEDEDHSIYSDETLEADDKALMLKIRDTILALTDTEKFSIIMNRMREAASSEAAQDPVKAVDEVIELLQVPHHYRGGILESLIKDHDYTLWGVANAITAQANEAESYDDAVDLEQLGSKVITLDPTQWQRIARAA